MQGAAARGEPRGGRGRAAGAPRATAAQARVPWTTLDATSAGAGRSRPASSLAVAARRLDGAVIGAGADARGAARGCAAARAPMTALTAVVAPLAAKAAAAFDRAARPMCLPRREPWIVHSSSLALSARECSPRAAARGARASAAGGDAAAAVARATPLLVVAREEWGAWATTADGAGARGAPPSRFRRTRSTRADARVGGVQLAR